eukprot:scaffold2184_cov128-Cylindrotheca_fusiformis.AAC.2
METYLLREKRSRTKQPDLQMLTTSLHRLATATTPSRSKVYCSVLDSQSELVVQEAQDIVKRTTIL